MEPGEPPINLLHDILGVKDGMDDQLRGVGLDDLTGLALAKDVGQIRSRFEGRNGSEVGRTSVHDTPSEDAYPAALSFMHIVGQLGHDATHFLLHD